MRNESYEDFLKNANWKKETERDYFHFVDPEKFNVVTKIVGMIILADSTEFGGYTLKPQGTDALLSVRLSYFAVEDYRDYETEMRELAPHISEMRMIPEGYDMVVEFVIKDFYYTQSIV